MSNRIFVGAVLMFLLLGIACQKLPQGQNEGGVRKISNKISLGSEWVEFTPQPPIEAGKNLCYIGLKISNVKGWGDANNETIALTDGSQLKIEIELINEKNQSTFLFPVGLAEFVEFGKHAKNRDNIQDAYFIKGEKFSKIRLKTNQPLIVDEVIWSELEL